jgi:hypothetical protein
MKYTVIFPSGRVMTFTVKAVAETYAKAYRGTLCQDRKTGEYYNPQEQFDKLLNSAEFINVMKRMSNV